MPPIRTAKPAMRQSLLPWSSRNTAPAGQISTVPTAAVQKRVQFMMDEEWEARGSRLGPGTRVISFGCGFVLTSKHIEDLQAMGKSICEKLWEFEFIYSDVGYDAHNSASQLTDADIKLLAQSCPGLRSFKLPGTGGLTHEALVALFEGCPNLSQVEITSQSRGGGTNTKAIFALLLERPDLAPNLRRLRLDKLCSPFTSSVEMKAMKAVTRKRKELLVELISVDEVKKWGDWELEVFGDEYQNGRVEKGTIYIGPNPIRLYVPRISRSSTHHRRKH